MSDINLTEYIIYCRATEKFIFMWLKEKTTILAARKLAAKQENQPLYTMEYVPKDMFINAAKSNSYHDDGMCKIYKYNREHV